MGGKLACLIKAAPPSPMAKNMPEDLGTSPQALWQFQAAQRLLKLLSSPSPSQRNVHHLLVAVVRNHIYMDK